MPPDRRARPRAERHRCSGRFSPATRHTGSARAGSARRAMPRHTPGSRRARVEPQAKPDRPPSPARADRARMTRPSPPRVAGPAGHPAGSGTGGRRVPPGRRRSPRSSPPCSIRGRNRRTTPAAWPARRASHTPPPARRIVARSEPRAEPRAEPRENLRSHLLRRPAEVGSIGGRTPSLRPDSVTRPRGLVPCRARPAGGPRRRRLPQSRRSPAAWFPDTARSGEDRRPRFPPYPRILGARHLERRPATHAAKDP